MGILLYIAALVVIAYGVVSSGAMPLPAEFDRVLTGALMVAGGVVIAGLGRLVQLMERLDDRLQPMERIANRLISKTETFDQTGPKPAGSTGAAGSSATRGADDTHTQHASESMPAMDDGSAETSAQPVAFEVARPMPPVGPRDKRAKHRGRDIIIHAEGGVSLKTLAGWRRFATMDQVNDYLGG